MWRIFEKLQINLHFCPLIRTFAAVEPKNKTESKIMDKQEFLKLGSDGKPMYIGHDLRRNS